MPFFGGGGGSGGDYHILTNGNITGAGAHGMPLVTGIDNMGLGTGALQDITTGSQNIAIGNIAGQRVKTDHGNIFLYQYNSDSPAYTVYTNSILIGTYGQTDNVTVTVDDAILIGENAAVMAQSGIAIGGNTAIVADCYYGVALGESATVKDTGVEGVAIGHTAVSHDTVNGTAGGIAVGSSADADNLGVAIGNTAISKNTAADIALPSGIAIGPGVTADTNSIAIGNGVTAAADKIVIGDSSTTSVTIGGIAFPAPPSAPSTDYTTPAAGFAYTVPNGTATAILEPAGTLATGTIDMPAVPTDGQRLIISSTQEITALTMSGNGNTLLGALVTIGANGFATWQYRTASTTWYRIG